MQKEIITISREFGSGGRTIGKRVAEALKIPFYDKELVEEVAKASNFSSEYIEQSGEHASSKYNFIYNLSLSIGAYSPDMLSPADKLFIVQSDIIQKIADKGPCVIVGRCADYILKDRTNALHAFIHADIESRSERIVTLYGELSDAPLKRLKEKDKTRELYYKHYTNQNWGDAKNYDIVLKSSSLGIDNCVKTIISLCE